ncbi:S1 family peptidase [Brevibacterium sp. UMB10442]|nr:S1 family peptidase [Brevibacterium sp. UMB10442]
MKRKILYTALAGAFALSGLAVTQPTAVHAGPQAVKPSPEIKHINPSFSDEQVKIMAKSSGRSEAAQRAHLEKQANQNNNLYDLKKDGYTYDGAFFDKNNKLVVQAPQGSKAEKAAKKKGLKVRHVKNGESKLNSIVKSLNKELKNGDDVASIAPDIRKDRVVITVTEKNANSSLVKKAKKFGSAVEFTQGKRNEIHSSAAGGDKISMESGGYCSAGFPATTRDGQKAMVWAGHCVENQQSFYANGGLFATHGDTAFKSYDGQPDYDIGYVVLTQGSDLSTDVNTYGSNAGISDSSRGDWKAPVGTDLCRTGATSGVTCGQVTGYNASVTYSDEYGQSVAQVSGLGTSTVCTAAGDSGGAYTSGGYAVGMTSGGPAAQRCGFNGGYVDGQSYFQPVTDALNYYGLTFG